MFYSRRTIIIGLRVLGLWILADLALWSVTGDIDRPGFYLHVTGAGGVVVGLVGAASAFAIAHYLSRRPARPTGSGDQAV